MIDAFWRVFCFFRAGLELDDESELVLEQLDMSSELEVLSLLEELFLLLRPIAKDTRESNATTLGSP